MIRVQERLTNMNIFEPDNSLLDTTIQKGLRHIVPNSEAQLQKRSDKDN